MVHFPVFCTRFVELQFPQKSKVLRTSAFVVPFLFDSFPLFFRVSTLTPHCVYVHSSVYTADMNAPFLFPRVSVAAVVLLGEL